MKFEIVLAPNSKCVLPMGGILSRSCNDIHINYNRFELVACWVGLGLGLDYELVD